MKLSVIIPVHNGGEIFKRSLEALTASARPPDELVVVDDASTDGSGGYAQEFGARVISLRDAALGPALARNRGAAVASGDILVFFDADVQVRPDSLARIEKKFREDSALAALFGSYDDSPFARNWVSLYKNLLHHYVHQHSPREASTFWAGCGAIRRLVFVSIGGFDESYANASIEDIELGTRLKRAGYPIQLCPEIQVTHLKHWTLVSLLRSDILHRAIPWTRLILRQGKMPAELNLNRSSRASAILVWIGLTAFIAAIKSVNAVWLAMGSLAFAVWLNRGLYAFFARRGGYVFMVGAIGLHFFHFIYSSSVFGSMLLWSYLRAWAGVIKRLSMTPRRALWLLLVVSLLKGIAWSIMLPPWHAPDENSHFGYGQLIERFGVFRPAPDQWQLAEIGHSWTVVQIRPVRFAPDVYLDLRDREGIAAQIARLDDPEVKRHYLYDDGFWFRNFRNFTLSHPPLYYALLGAIQFAFESESILVRILMNRWFSVALAVMVTALAYSAGVLIWRNEASALLLATLVSFQPMLTFITSVINNNALEIVMYSACLLAGLRILHMGISARRGLILGILLGASFLTRTSLLSLIPLVLFLLLWNLRASARTHKLNLSALLLWAWVMALPVILAGWWYAGLGARDPPSTLSTLGQGSGRSLVGHIEALAAYDWRGTYGRLLEMYWGNFGWLDTPLPSALTAFLTWTTVIVVSLVLVRLFLRGFKRDRGVTLVVILWLGLAAVAPVLFYTYLDIPLVPGSGSRFFLQGRYFLSPIIAHMACLMVGLLALASLHWRHICMWLVALAMIALNMYALFSVVTLRYYGARNLWLVADRAAVLQPVSADTVYVLCALYLALTGVLILALFPAFKHRLGAN